MCFNDALREVLKPPPGHTNGNQAVKLDAKNKQFPVPFFNKKATVPWRINK